DRGPEHPAADAVRVAYARRQVAQARPARALVLLGVDEAQALGDHLAVHARGAARRAGVHAPERDPRGTAVAEAELWGGDGLQRLGEGDTDRALLPPRGQAAGGNHA